MVFVTFKWGKTQEISMYDWLHVSLAALCIHVLIPVWYSTVCITDKGFKLCCNFSYVCLRKGISAFAFSRFLLLTGGYSLCGSLRITPILSYIDWHDLINMICYFCIICIDCGIVGVLRLFGFRYNWLTVIFLSAYFCFICLTKGECLYVYICVYVFVHVYASLVKHRKTVTKTAMFFHHRDVDH